VDFSEGRKEKNFIVFRDDRGENFLHAFDPVAGGRRQIWGGKKIRTEERGFLYSVKCFWSKERIKHLEERVFDEREEKPF